MATAVQQVSRSTQLQTGSMVLSQSSITDSGNFTCSISVDCAKYSISEDVLPWIMFVLTNKSSSTAYYVLKWHTPLEGFRSNHLRVYCNDEELTYEGIAAKRGNPDQASYDLLLPGSSVSGSVYLGEAYDLKPGVYCVRLNTSLLDVIEDKGDDFQPHAINDFEGMDLKCEPIVFEILA